MGKLPAFYESAPKSLQKLMKKDPSVGEYLAKVEAGES
jgi:hypothetical protein